MTQLQLHKLDHSAQPLDADCVETCPVNLLPNTTTTACGTYQLDPSTGKRNGGITLYHLSHTIDPSDPNLLSAAPQQYVECPAGLFDMKWSRQFDATQENPCLACAAADGSVYVYSVSSEDQLVLNASARVSDEPDTFCLSLDWSNKTQGSLLEDKIAVSRNDGKVTVLERAAGGDLVETMTFSAHTYQGTDTPAETWICAFDAFQRELLFTGADDGLLKLWDLRMGGHAPTATNRSHQAGVCSLQSNPHREYCLASGSYDHQIRIWDTRKMRRPVCETEDVQGGVWRLKWHPHAIHHDKLLTACMRGGYQLYEANDSSIHELARYTEGPRSSEGAGHEDWESLAYGVDWIPTGETSAEIPGQYVGGCSFYDKCFRLLQIQETCG